MTISSDELLRPLVEEEGSLLVVKDRDLSSSVESVEWGWRQKISLRGEKSTTYFPVLVEISEDADITFAQDSEGRKPLPFYREGVGKFWVEIPFISATRDTSFYAFGDFEIGGERNIWDKFKAVHPFNTSLYRTVPLYQGITRYSNDDNLFAQALQNGVAIAAKQFDDAPKNAGGLLYGDPAYTDHLFVMEMRTTVPTKVLETGFLEIGSAETPNEEAIQSGSLKGKGITEDWKTIVIPMSEWLDISHSGALGKATVVAGTTNNDPRQIRKVSGSFSFKDDFPLQGGIKIEGTPDEYKAIAKHGPLVLSGGLRCEAGNDTVDGDGTSFLDQVKIGDVIWIEDTQLAGVVLTVDSDVEITMSTLQAVTIGDADSFEQGYVGTEDNIAYLESAVSVTHTNQDISTGSDVIKLRGITFLRWKQHLDAVQGRIEFRNARLIYPTSGLSSIGGVLSSTVGSATVTGGANFTGEVKLGHSIEINGHILPGYVHTIGSASSLTMTENADVTLSGSGKSGMRESSFLDVSGNYISLEHYSAAPWDDTGYTQTPPTLSSEGRSGSAVSFDGSDQYLRFTSGLDIETSSFTFEASFKSLSPDSERLVLIGNSKMSLYVDESGVTLEWDSGSITETKGPTTLLSDGEWHYVGLVRDKSRNRFMLYVDGIEYTLTSGNSGEDITFTEIEDDEGGEPLFVGSEGNGDVLASLTVRDSTTFIGLIDEVRISLGVKLAGWFSVMDQNLRGTLLTFSEMEENLSSGEPPAGLEVSMGADGKLYINS